MAARALLASCVFLAFAAFVCAQDRQAVIIVDVNNRTYPSHSRLRFHEDRYARTVANLHSARTDTVLVYTDFVSRIGTDLNTFLANITGTADSIIKKFCDSRLSNDVNECWKKFEFRLKKIEHDARKEAENSCEIHHKFMLGHLIVSRMHLNKSEDYLKRCDKVTRGCGRPRCEVTPRVLHWQRCAQREIELVRKDQPFTRRYFRDVVSHSRRKLNHLKKQAVAKSCDAVEEYKQCICM